ncbi:DUF397 domain-containing protein [Streptomyces sp. NPDC007808]|uniref:DUF397 domain-containing protein n=1 Tax=Streptomyces sp. NPDC007808 TaxID=3364779 RepID=UPI0036773FDB
MKSSEPTLRDASALRGWRKSSYSGGSSGNCLEVHDTPLPTTHVPVRDSKRPTGPAVVFSASAWAAFVAQVC